MADLTSAEFDLAFVFSRSEALPRRDAGGVLVTAPIDAPRFDHDIDGKPLGLLITAGAELGGQDRCAIDPLMLPVDLFDQATPLASDATVFHRFDPGAGERRVAIYSRNARATIDALLRSTGHHIEIGVVRGHRPAEDGAVRYRGHAWELPAMLLAGAQVLAASPDKPLITSGAEQVGLG